jgi:hypothetical protein
MSKSKSILNAKGNIRKSHFIKSVCVGGRSIENYSPKNSTKVKAEIDTWMSVDKTKSIIRMRGEYTLNYQGFIYWN